MKKQQNKKMQNKENVAIPTLEDLQQRFHAVPRFRDPNKREYVWFKADDVARVFGYSDFSDDLMYLINHLDRVCVGRQYYDLGGTMCGNSTYTNTTLGQECMSFLDQYKNVINQYGVAQVAERTRLPFCIKFKYWLYSTYTLTTIGDEPILRDLEIIDDGSCIIEARKTPKTKQTVETNNDNEKKYVTHEEQNAFNIEYEREITKRLEIEKNFQLEMHKLEVYHHEIDHPKLCCIIL